MGRGDKKTKKGKIFAGSYGKKRVRKENTEQKFVKSKDKKEEVEVVDKKKAAPKKKVAKKAK